MPGHETHELVNIVILIPVLIGLYHVTPILNIVPFALGYLLCTFYLTPDLDINSKPYNRWKSLRILWWPYKTLFKHRGISHHPIWGPISLIGYWIILISPILYLIQLPFIYIIAPILGMIIAIELHIITDSIG